MTSSNGNIFGVTGPLCGEFTSPCTKASDVDLWSVHWINVWVNNRDAGGLKHHRAHYDVIIMLFQFSNLPVCSLIGGRFGESVPLYRAICQLDPESMRDNVLKYKAEGYKKFQLKVGGDPDEDIQRIKLIRSALDDRDTLICDANTGECRFVKFQGPVSISDKTSYREISKPRDW